MRIGIFLLLCLIPAYADAKPVACSPEQIERARKEEEAIRADPEKMRLLRSILPPGKTIEDFFIPRCYEPDVAPPEHGKVRQRHGKDEQQRETRPAPSCLASAPPLEDSEVIKRTDQCLISKVGEAYFLGNYTRLEKVDRSIRPETGHCYYGVKYRYWPIQKRSPGNPDFSVVVPQNPDAPCGSDVSVVRDGRIIEPMLSTEQALKIMHDELLKRGVTSYLPSLEEILAKKKTDNLSIGYSAYITFSVHPKEGARWLWIVSPQWISKDKPNCVNSYSSIAMDAETGELQKDWNEKIELETHCTPQAGMANH